MRPFHNASTFEVYIRTLRGRLVWGPLIVISEMLYDELLHLGIVPETYDAIEEVIDGLIEAFRMGRVDKSYQTANDNIYTIFQRVGFGIPLEEDPIERIRLIGLKFILHFFVVMTNWLDSTFVEGHPMFSFVGVTYQTREALNGLNMLRTGRKSPRLLLGEYRQLADRIMHRFPFREGIGDEVSGVQGIDEFC